MTSETLRKDAREVLQGSSSSLVIRVAGLGAGYLPLFILSNYYGPDAVGVYALSLSVFLTLMILTTLGMPRAQVKLMAKAIASDRPGDVGTVYRNVLTLVVPCSALAGVLLFAASDWLATAVFHEEAMARALRIVALILPCSALVITNASALNGLKRITESTLFTVVVTPLICALILTFLYLQCVPTDARGVEAYGIAVVCSALLSTLVWRTRRPHQRAIGTEPAITVRKLLILGWPMLVTSSMQTLMANTDAIMLGMWYEMGDVGVYRVAVRVGGLISVPLFAVAAIAAPKFAEIGKGHDTTRLKQMASFTARLLAWSTLPLCAVVLVSGRWLLSLFGPAFETGLAALIIIGVSQCVNALCGVIGVLLEMTGREKVLRNAITVGALANILLNVLLIPPFGITGAAIATASSTILWNVSLSFYALRHYGFWVGYLPAWCRRESPVS